VCRNPKASAPFKKLTEHQVELFAKAHMPWGFWFTNDPSHLRSDEALRFLEFIRKRQDSNPEDIFAFQHRLDRKGNVQAPLDTSDEEYAAEIKSHKRDRSMYGKLGKGSAEGLGSIQAEDEGDADENEAEDEPDDPNMDVDTDQDGSVNDGGDVIEWSASDCGSGEEERCPSSHPISSSALNVAVSDQVHREPRKSEPDKSALSSGTEKGKGKERHSPHKDHQPREKGHVGWAQTLGFRAQTANGGSVFIQQNILDQKKGEVGTTPATLPQVMGEGNRPRPMSGSKKDNGTASQRLRIKATGLKVREMPEPDRDGLPLHKGT
jgi:hypothetical protein